MKNKLFSVLFLSILVFALAACGSDESKTDDTSTNKGTTEETPAKATGKVVEATINATNFEFDIKEIKANVGDTVKLTVVNGSGAHGVGIDEFNVNVAGGDTVEFVVDTAGEFDYYCSLLCGVGHDKMAGKLIVE